MTIAIQTDQKLLKQLVARRHPDYDKKREHWCFLHETYLGSREWFKKHIFKFSREGAETYLGRVERAYRFNHTREVVDLVNKYLFKLAPVRTDEVPDAVKRFRQRATLSGLGVDEFERQVGVASSIFGRCYVVVDNDYAPDGNAPRTLAQEKEMDGQLYAYIVHPQDFLDCGYDKGGQYAWVLLREIIRDDSDPFTSSGACREAFRLWTREGWALFTVNSKGRVDLIQSGVHGLGVVPVLKADHVESDQKFVVPALIEDIAYLDRATANYLSNLDQIINDQTFSQLVMPAQGVLNGAPQANTKDKSDPDHEAQRRHLVKLGTSQILLYDGEHGSAPSYISPDPKQANLLIDTVSKIINEIYHTVGLAGERTKADNSQGIDNSSGVAKAFDFERVNALLSAKANAMQSFSNRLEALVAIYAGENITIAERGKDTVAYPMNFDVRNLIEDLSIANELSLMMAPIEIRRVQMKAIVKKLWPMMADPDMKKLESAIDSWDDPINIGLSADLGNDSGVNDGKPGQGAVGGKETVSKVGH
jgi:hypothetical protein